MDWQDGQILQGTPVPDVTSPDAKSIPFQPNG